MSDVNLLSANPLSVSKQYIDKKGKCRVYIRDGVYIYTDPIHPFNIGTFDLEEITPCVLSKAQEYIKKYSLEPVSQVGDAGGISGIWLKNNEYIFIKPQKGSFLEGIPQTIKIPIILKNSTQFKDQKQRKLVAHYIKQYALHLYSRKGELETVIIPGYRYNIETLKGLFIEDSPLFQGDKLIVTSNELDKRVKSYVQQQLFLNKEKVLNMKNHNIIEEFYNEMTSFSQKNKELVCDNIELIKKNNNNLTKDYRLNVINFDEKEPYMFLNENISKKMVMIQNVEDCDYERALTVATSWFANVNKGYHAEVDIEVEEVEDENNIIIHDIDLDFDTEDIIDPESDNIRLLKVGDKYAAILEL